MRKVIIFNRKRLLSFVILYLFFIFVFRLTYNEFIFDVEYKIRSSSAASELKILVWHTPNRSLKTEALQRYEDFVKSNNENPCLEGCRLKFSRNQEEVDKADAVIFFTFTTKKDLPVRKNFNQIWIYRLFEPPLHRSPEKSLNGQFNWTISYRKDSDIVFQYRRLLPRKEPYQLQHGGILQNQEKADLGVALISNCRAKSKRLEILKKLNQSGLPIDIYGGCGITEGICGRHNGSCEDFMERLASKYKFYFAFENSLCSDYITEKFWRPLQLGMIPVVLGRGDYEKVAPPHSFIDIRDFPNPKDLVDYFKMLDKDSRKYEEYFEWKEKYEVGGGPSTICEACTRLKLLHEEIKHQTKRGVVGVPLTPAIYYSNKTNYISEWWAKDSSGNGPACITPEAMGLQNYLV